MDAEAEFLDLVYEAAVAPERWMIVCERYADLVNGAGATLLFQNQTTGAGELLSTLRDPKEYAPVFSQYAARNPLLRITDLPARPRVLTDEEKLPKSELVRSEYYNEFLRHIETHSLLMARLAVEGNNTVVLNIGRPATLDPFGPAELAIANRLQPHLVRAYHVSTRLTGIGALAQGLREVVDHSVHGTFLVDRSARVTYMNKAGEMLISQKQGLAIRLGVLHAATQRATQRLHTLIAKAASLDGARSSGAVALERPELRPLSVLVSPLPPERTPVFLQTSSVLVSVGDPEGRPPVAEDRLRALFGLTRAEARLAAQLLHGRDLSEAARHIGVSIHTVRVHLARIFTKTDTRRQAELVRLLIASLSPASGHMQS